MANQIDIKIGQRIRSRLGVNYRILQLLGAGGNSFVYLVLALNHQYRGVLFALKLFTRLSEPQRLKTFWQEAEFLRNCNHPSIMRIYDNGVFTVGTEGEAKNYPFVIAEYLPKTMQDLIRGTTTTAERVSYTLQLLSALTFLDQHNPSVVHRDIKPKNIFVKGRSCVLGDFGLMKFLDGEDETDRHMYRENVGPGMPFFYRTPDLVTYAKEKRVLTTKSDVFQLGLVIAQIFTGRNPEKKAQDFLDPVKLEPLGEVPGALQTTIRDLIENMLALDPESRPAAHSLIDPWEGLFREVVDRCHQLDGRVF